jgi:protein TonB
MREVVQEILAQRSARSPRRQQRFAAIVAVVLHAAVVTAAFAVPYMTREPPRQIEYVEVTVLPPQALGVEQPASRPRPEAPPPAPEPEPEESEPALPLPEPEPADRKPEPEPPEEPARRDEAEPAPARESSEPRGPEALQGSPTGAPGGTSRLGAEVLGPEGASFAYDYYLEQMLSQIRQSWVRPPMEGVRALVTFRVLADGQIRNIEVRESSGSRSFDLAAVRAVRNASPLPPLPASYRRGSLTVNLIVR